jgi:hypothetical protein
VVPLREVRPVFELELRFGAAHVAITLATGGSSIVIRRASRCSKILNQEPGEA